MTFVVNITSNGVFVKGKERDVHKKGSIGKYSRQLAAGSRQKSEIRRQRSEVRGKAANAEMGSGQAK